MNSISEDSIYIRDSLNEVINSLKEGKNYNNSRKIIKTIEYLEYIKKYVNKNISLEACINN